MEEILQNLLSSELLNEEARAEISQKWNTAVASYKTQVREEVSLEVRAELAEQWATERDTLIENVERFVSTKLVEEFEELKSEIERFRDLEAEYAEKIVEEKHAMAAKLSEEFDQLVDKMDAFFEMRLKSEFEELREDFEVVKQNDFGRRIFEAFVTEFNKSHVDEESTTSRLAAAVAKLEDAQSTIAKLEESQAKMIRESKLEKLLAPLSGRKREQMAFVLQNVETSRLEEGYNHFITRILKEEASQAKPTQTLTESTKVVTGEQGAAPAAKESSMAALRVLAGINE